MSRILTQSDYTSALVSQRNDLADNIDTKGVEAERTEKLNTLVPKVLEIPSGGGDNITAGTVEVSPIVTELNFAPWAFDFEEETV